MRFHKVLRITCSLLTATTVMGAFGILSANGAGAEPRGEHGDSTQLFVSPTGTPTNSGESCETARYSRIQAAVKAAPDDSTVIVCKGTYTEDVVVDHPLSLHGLSATIKGTTKQKIMCDQLGPGGPGSAPCLAGVTIKSSQVEVEGFVVTGAIGEGILATGSLAGHSISDVTIEHNKVLNNNTGGIPPTTASPYPQCVAMGQIPGDCGEGIHLMGVTNSEVGENFITGNEGGVLMTDEFGPTHGNVVEENIVVSNLFDCGITVPGHNPFALDAAGKPQPAVAGVYDNVIRDNWVTGNGLKGEGAGVLFANAGPGTASYNNLVEGNYLAGNQLSGVTMHAHTLPPGMLEDLSGNRIVDNVIGRNNVGSPIVPGDPLDGPPAQDFHTTGILVFSGTVQVQVTIADNFIFDNHFGIWLGINHLVTAHLDDNKFFDVGTHVFTFS